jgi:hypothetical protein
MMEGPPLTRWFPLVPRSRPACGVLAKRVFEIAELATAAADGSVAARMSAEAQKKAALITSDCRVPDRAHVVLVAVRGGRHGRALRGRGPARPATFD